MEQQEEVEGLGVKKCTTELEGETEGRKLGGRVPASSDPNAGEKEETANLFLPAARKGTDLGRHRELRSVWWGQEGERVRAPQPRVYERGAGGLGAAGMAEKRRGSPCSMLSLKAHAFSVEALIGAEKQQQLQKKRRKLATEEAAGAVDDAGCSRGGGAGEHGCSEADEEAAPPPPAAGTASGPARSCADAEQSCASRGPAGESTPSRPSGFPVRPRPDPANLSFARSSPASAAEPRRSDTDPSAQRTINPRLSAGPGGLPTSLSLRPGGFEPRGAAAFRFS